PKSSGTGSAVAKALWCVSKSWVVAQRTARPSSWRFLPPGRIHSTDRPTWSSLQITPSHANSLERQKKKQSRPTSPKPQKKSDRERTANKEKSGVFTGAFALNPLTD